jgi:hypothetical protein
MTPNGGWRKSQLAAWGVPWPPPKGWKKRLLNQPKVFYHPPSYKTFAEGFAAAAKDVDMKIEMQNQAASNIKPKKKRPSRS